VLPLLLIQLPSSSVAASSSLLSCRVFDLGCKNALLAMHLFGFWSTCCKPLKAPWSLFSAGPAGFCFLEPIKLRIFQLMIDGIKIHKCTIHIYVNYVFTFLLLFE